MSFSDRKFQQAYLKIISEQTEQAVIPTGVCKKCNLSFTDDVAKVGDACPACGETIEAYDIADYAGDGIDMPEPYEKPAEECNEITTECGDGDILEEDDFALEQADDEDLIEEQETDEDLIQEQELDDDLVEEQDEDDLVEEQDNDLIPAEPINDYIVTEQDETAEGAEEANTDSSEAQEADDAAATEDTDDAENTDLAESKIISFTSADPALIEVFEKVQAGELKLVAVPLDFQFAEEDKNTNPDITAEVLDNFDIENVTDSSDEEAIEDAEATPATDEASAESEESTAETADETAKEAEATPAKQEKVVKECKVKTPAIAKVKFNKQGPY